MRTRPTWNEFACEGKKISAALPLKPEMSYEEIGAQLGISKANARSACEVALGKLAWNLEQRGLTKGSV